MLTTQNKSVNSTQLDLANLANLVKDRNADQILLVINQAIINKGWQWRYSEEVELAMRDAILLGHQDIVKLFLKAGISVDLSTQKDNNSKSTYRFIYFAVISNNLEMVKLLVEAGADITPYNKYHDTGNDTAIDTAINEGHVEIVKYLLEQGAKARDSLRNYPYEEFFIIHAAKHDRFDIMDLLFQYGAAKDIKFSFYSTYQEYSDSIKDCTDKLSSTYSDIKKNQLIDYASNNKSIFKSDYEKQLVIFENEKIEIQNKLSAALPSYEKVITNLMDYAIGVDISSEEISDLQFLSPLKTVAGINFIGISVKGRPITREMLKEAKLTGADQAILTLNDLETIANTPRGQALKERINLAINKQGKLIQNGIINLVPLCTSAKVGDVEAVKTRLQAGIDPNEKGDTLPIVLAAANNHEEIIDVLLEHPNFDGQTLIAAIQAVKSENITLKNKLLNAQNIDTPDSSGDTLLHHAIKDGNVAEVNKLIAKGANVNLKGAEDYPLHLAAINSFRSRFSKSPSIPHITILKILLENQADPNLINHHNLTAMDKLAHAGSAEALALLLPITKKRNIEIWVDDLHHTASFPWYTQIMFNTSSSPEWHKILILLKNHGADFNQKTSYGRPLLTEAMLQTPSMSSVRNTMRDISSSIKGRKEIYLQDSVSNEYTRLLQKNRRNYFKHLTLINFLLENKTDPNLRDKSDDTALHILLDKIDLNGIENGYANIIDKCLLKGYDINAVNKDGETLLHIAASRGRLNAVKYLLTRGADINAKDTLGRTPLHYVESKLDTIPKQDIQSQSLPNYTYETQRYIDQCKSNSQSILKLENLPLDTEDKNLLETYRDEFSHQLYVIPVILNERVYNLEALLTILEKDKKDPFTGKSFDLSDIQPAEKTAFELQCFIECCEKKYPAKKYQPNVVESMKMDNNQKPSSDSNLGVSQFGLYPSQKSEPKTDEVTNEEKTYSWCTLI